jgi:hypothetical protein
MGTGKKQPVGGAHALGDADRVGDVHVAAQRREIAAAHHHGVARRLGADGQCRQRLGLSHQRMVALGVVNESRLEFLGTYGIDHGGPRWRVMLFGASRMPASGCRGSPAMQAEAASEPTETMRDPDGGRSRLGFVRQTLWRRRGPYHSIADGFPRFSLYRAQ